MPSFKMADIIQHICWFSDLDTKKMIHKLIKEIAEKHDWQSIEALSGKLASLKALKQFIQGLSVEAYSSGNKIPSNCVTSNIIASVCFPFLHVLQPSFDEREEVLMAVLAVCDLLIACLEKSEDAAVRDILVKCLYHFSIFKRDQQCVFDRFLHDEAGENLDVYCIVEILKGVLSMNKVKQDQQNSSFAENGDLWDDIFSTVLSMFSLLSDKMMGRLVAVIVTTLLRQDVGKRDNRLNDLWNVVKKLEDRSIENKIAKYHEQRLLVISSLADFYFPISGKVFCEDLRCSDEFWKIVQHGLIHVNPVTRKRAVYLLKRIVDICDKNEVDVNVCASGMSCPLFLWEKNYSKHLVKMWEDFILLVETLEEKQVHVVRPVLGRMQNLMKAASMEDGDFPHLHTSWLVTVISRCFTHESIFVVRWAAETVLSIDFSTLPMIQQGQEEYLAGPFLYALKELRLYTRSPCAPVGSCPSVGSGLICFFRNCCEVLWTPDRQASFIKQVLKTILSTAWSSISLMFICQGLAHIPSAPLLDTQVIMDLKEIVNSSLITMDVYTKGAIQCFLTLTLVNLLDVRSVDPKDFASVICTFEREESLQRGTTLWKQISDWLRTITATPGVEQWSRVRVQQTVSSMVQDYLTVNSELEINQVDNIHVNQISSLLLLAADADLFSDKSETDDLNLDKILSWAVDTLNLINSHPYMSNVKADKAINLLMALAKEQGQSKNPDRSADQSIQKAYRLCWKELYTYIRTRITQDMKQMSNVHLIHLYSEIVKHSLRYKSPEDCSYSLLELAEGCVRNLDSLKGVVKVRVEHQMLMVASTSMLGSLSVIMGSQDDPVAFSSVTACLRGYAARMKMDFNFSRPVDFSEGSVTGMEQKDWGRIVSQFMTNQWECLYFMLKTSPDHGHIPVKTLLDSCFEAFDVGSWSSDVPVMKCFGCILPKLVKGSIYSDAIIQAIDIAWVKANEEHHTAGFWVKLTCFVTMAFQKCLIMLEESTDLAVHLQKYVSLLFKLGEDKCGVVNILINHLLQLCTLGEGIEVAVKLVPVFAQACMFGSIHKRTDKLFIDVGAYLESLQENCSVNEVIPCSFRSDLFVRIMVHSFLSKLKLGIKEHVKLAVSLWRELSQCFAKLVDKTDVKQYRYNSLGHRQKQRIFQALLVLEPLIIKENCDEFWSFVWKYLAVEIHPSVRHMQEWLVLRLIVQFPHLLEKLWLLLDQFSENSMGLCSVIIIISKLGHHLPKQLQNDFYMEAIPQLMPWCTANHFNTRIHAQATLIKLWDHCRMLGLKQPLETHAIVEKFLSLKYQNNNATKNVDKLLNNYFYQTFDFVGDYSIETIFLTLPMLACLSDEEWIPPKMFCQWDSSWLNGDQRFIPLHNKTDTLKECKPGAWKIKATGKIEDEEEESSNGDVQKKIMPWLLMTPDEETQYEYEFKKKVHKPGGLILVTSLIDKIPNLGGLCRTSEIFGVSEYVIGKLHYTEDKVFQSLSVTAQKWIPITEVYQERLMEFMEDKRREGYTLVGAEQTANSISLTEYKFPTKTLLLLGNEKEGIPANLIQLLDVCVQIPQQGVIRSLNVHVSGALLIWEYTRQQMENQAS